MMAMSDLSLGGNTWLQHVAIIGVSGEPPGRPAILGLTRAQSPDQASGRRNGVGLCGVERARGLVIPGFNHHRRFTADVAVRIEDSPDARPPKVLNQVAKANEGFHFGNIPLARRKYQAGGQRSGAGKGDGVPALAVYLGSRFYFPGNLPGTSSA